MTRRSAGRTPQRARTRYGRIAVLAASLAMTAAATVASVGLLPHPGDSSTAMAADVSRGHVLDFPPDTGQQPTESRAAPYPDAVDPASTPPPRSGQGRRIVFDMSDQRVWLVRADGTVLDSYLVSGSRLDNLEAGTYEVYSKSLDAIGYTGNSTMRHMVRFTEGENASIGFHDIPLDEQGRRVQTVEQLGSPRSVGCIRQRAADARKLWAFAPVGTRVVVLD